ncbi:2-hydroxy-3-oxopropionate reductase [Arthrobacter sp. Soil736]|nr:2-hydroxy-3-oxopropionate reductase [Arthrobacter sp. Soil736]
MSTIAFIGLGTMGRGMVNNLLHAGHNVTVWNRSPEQVNQAVTRGATSAATLAEATKDADFVMYCLSDDAAVREVVLASGGLAETVNPDSIVIDLSTIDPETSAEEAEAFAARNVAFLDAPVFGSKGEAAAGGLWVVAGGELETFNRARPVLSAISETTHYMGPSGNGARMKLVGNLLVAAQLEALGESLSLARKAGLSLHDVLGVLKVTDFRSPIFDGVGAAVVAGDYTPSFALNLMLKDGKLVQTFAERLGVSVPGTRATVSTIERAVEAGFGNENASALIKVLASDAGVDLTDETADHSTGLLTADASAR